MAGQYVYWISTALLCLLYLSSAFIYLTKREWVATTIAGFGYPTYLVPVLTVVKVVAVVAILSRANVAISDLAYAGMLYHLLLSAGAHIGVRKASGAVPAAIGLVLLVVSFATQNLAREPLSPLSQALGL